MPQEWVTAKACGPRPGAGCSRRWLGGLRRVVPAARFIWPHCSYRETHAAAPKSGRPDLAKEARHATGRAGLGRGLVWPRHRLPRAADLVALGGASRAWRDLVHRYARARLWLAAALGVGPPPAAGGAAALLCQPDTTLSLRLAAPLPPARSALLRSALACYPEVRSLCLAGPPPAVAQLLAAWRRREGTGRRARRLRSLTLELVRAPGPASPWTHLLRPGLRAVARDLYALTLAHVDFGDCTNARLYGPDFDRLAPCLADLRVWQPCPDGLVCGPEDTLALCAGAGWPRLARVRLERPLGLYQLLAWLRARRPRCPGLGWPAATTPALQQYELVVATCDQCLWHQPGAEDAGVLADGALAALLEGLCPAGRPAWLQLELQYLDVRGSGPAGPDLADLAPYALSVLDRGPPDDDDAGRGGQAGGDGATTTAATRLARAFVAQPGRGSWRCTWACRTAGRCRTTRRRWTARAGSSAGRAWERAWPAGAGARLTRAAFRSFNLPAYVMHYIRHRQRGLRPWLLVQDSAWRALCALGTPLHVEDFYLYDARDEGPGPYQPSPPGGLAPHVVAVSGRYTFLRPWEDHTGAPVHRDPPGWLSHAAWIFLACSGLLGRPQSPPEVFARLGRERTPWLPRLYPRAWAQDHPLRQMLLAYLGDYLQQLRCRGDDDPACLQWAALAQLCALPPAPGLDWLSSRRVLEDPRPRRRLQLLAPRLWHGVGAAVRQGFARWPELVTRRWEALQQALAPPPGPVRPLCCW
eukprot:g50114.t1